MVFTKVNVPDIIEAIKMAPFGQIDIMITHLPSEGRVMNMKCTPEERAAREAEVDRMMSAR